MQKLFRNLLVSGGIIGALLCTFKVSAQQTLTQINSWNAYVHLPASYATSTQTYPTIIFFPGIGEVGTVASKVIAHGPGAYITQGWNGNVSVNGNTVEFIVISLQPPNAFPNEIAMNQRIQTIKNQYRVDTNKLFLTGLSHGGWCSSTFVTGDAYGGPYNYASQIAAVVTVQGMKPEDNQPYPNLFDNFALTGGKMLGFEQALDGRDTRTVIDRMNATVPNSAIYVQTNFGGGGHCCWNQFYGGQGVTPANFMLEGISQNIYQWLARQALGTINQLPVSSAGADQTLTLPVNYTTLSGSSTDPDGTVLTNLWMQVSGPSVADIFNVIAPVTQISNLIQGEYKFSLKVTDNSGGSSTDTVKITVEPPVISPCNTNAPVTYILTPTQPGEIYIPNASTRPWKGGDTLKIPAGTYSVIELGNFKGDPCNKIIITNMGGVVQSPNIRLKSDAKYFRLSGAGTPGIEYGFKVVGGSLAVSLCHDFEIDHVETSGGSLGMYIKTNPEEAIPMTVYTPGSPTNYLMKNIYLHHNYVHDINGEGMYIGHTGPSGGQNGNGSNGQPLMPIRLDNVEIAYNIIENTNWDGIQLSNARNNCKIHHNTVKNFGIINMNSQQSGIILGGNTNGDVYNNTVTKGTGNGIEIFGYGQIKVYNNFVDSAGHDNTTVGQESVFANDNITGPETNPKQQILFYNNSVYHPKSKGAIRVGAYYSNSLAASLTNNQYCIPGAPTNWISTYVVANPTGSILSANTLNCSAVPNQPPIANAGNDLAITLPVALATLTGSGTDPDGTITGYSWTKLSGPAVTITSATTPVTTVTGLLQGVYSFELRVTDNGGLIGKDTVVVTVQPLINLSPLVNAGADATITLPVNTSPLNGTASDPDGTIASYQWTKILGPSATITNATSANATAAAMTQGIYQFELRVTDNFGAISRDTTQITVNPAPNQAPSANAGNDIVITLPVDNTILNGSGTDPDGTIVSYQWTKVSGPAAGILSNATSSTASATSLVQGTYVYQLAVTDNAGATATDVMSVVVNAAVPPPNQSPAANAGNDITITLPVNSATLNGSGTDPDGIIINYQWSKISGPTAGIITNGTSANATASGLVQGTYQFQLLVTDNNGATASDVMTVTVNPAPNQVPTANAGNDIVLTLPVNTTILNGVASDPDGTIVSYLWTKISGPASATLTNATSANATVTDLTQGVYQFQLLVIDNSGATATDIMQVTVNAAANQLPTADAGSDIVLTLPVSNTILNGNGNDPDGTIVSYQWTKISGPAAGIISNATSAIATATGLVEGIYQFQLEVTDDNGASATDIIQVTVNPAPNQAPIANAGTDISITLPTNTITLLGTGTDPDGTITGYAWTQISGPSASAIANPASANSTVTGLVQGVYQFQLQVTDSNGATAADIVLVIVNAAIPPPNQAPVVDAGNDITITLPLNSTALNSTANDPDGTITSYQWTKISGPATGIIVNPTASSATASALTAGVYEFQVQVTDNNGAIASDVIQVTVNPAPNQLPVANAGADKVLTLPANATTLIGSGSDPDGTIVSYQWSKLTGPSNYMFGNTNAASTGLGGLVQGIYTFELLVTDNSGATDRDTMQVTVNPAPNQAPTANAGNDITITLPINTTTLDGSGIDPDGTIASYQWTKIAGPTSGTITNATSASATAAGLVQGTYQFQLVVTDNNGATASDVMIVTVNPAPNQAPTANAGNDITITLPINTTTLNGSGIDPDGTIASYQWTKIAGPAAGTITNATSANATATGLVQGTYQFQLVVTDNSGATASDVMTVTVNPAPNQVPTANAGNDITITLPVNTTTLNGSGIDPDGTIALYQWTKIAGPATGTITNATSANATASGLVQGTYQFQLVVTDNSGATASDVMTVTVNPAPNQAPTANAGNDITITLPVNTTALNGIGIDPDGTITSFQWTKIAGPTAGTIVNATSANATATGLVQGTYQFQLRVTDNNGATAIDIMTVIVNPAANQAPAVNAGNDITITLPLNTASLNGIATDPDGSIVSYQWTKTAGPTSGTITNATSPNATATGLVQGTYQFQLTVTDNSGATALDVMMVTVNAAPNQTPTAHAGADKILTLPSNSTTLIGTAIDPDGTIASYLWTKVSGPSAYLLGNANAASTGLGGLIAGVYQFELKVTDNNGAADTDTMQVTVNPAPNQAPSVNAGNDVTITLPVNSALLNGTANDPDGTIVSYQWVKISGPATGSIANATSANAAATGLVQGIYQYQLTVTDNSGAMATDVMTITVLMPNQTPTANAGLDQNMNLPSNATTLTGSGNDNDGTIVGYLWTKISGPSCVITQPLSAVTTVTGMVQGLYKFELKVTDNNGATDRDTMVVNLNATIPPPNQRPVVDAGNDVSIYLPVNSVSVTGSAVDNDGTITSRSWSVISGPSGYAIQNASAGTATITNMQQGIYYVKFTATDNDGASSSDTVRIDVGSARTQAGEYVRIFPNPVLDKLNVEINTATLNRKVLITVRDIHGKIVMQKQPTILNTIQLEVLEMSRLAAGEYFVTTQYEGESPVTKKVLKL